jgi:dTDP-4-dehydrorhamnose 3,5-epimerase
MEFRELRIRGLFEITPRKFKDERGYFFESFNEKTFKDAGLDLKFLQDNQSFSIPNVIRGLHFQKPPFAQGKLVRVLEGKILDVAVDLRPDSPTYKQWESIILDGERSNMIYIPEGFAHGFSVLEESSVLYKCTNIYNKSSEGGINWADPDLKIDWQIKNPLISEKDEELSFLKDLKLK